MLQQLSCELTTLTPMAWALHVAAAAATGEPLNQLQPTVRPDSLAFPANQLAATHIPDVPFSVNSTASQIGLAAWAVSALLWWRLCSVTQL